MPTFSLHKASLCKHLNSQAVIQSFDKSNKRIPGMLTLNCFKAREHYEQPLFLRLIQHLYMPRVVTPLPSKELSKGTPAAPAANTTDFM